MQKALKNLIFLASFFTITLTALAATGDISINQNDLRFSNYNFLEGQAVRIYATTSNNSEKDLLGTVRFFDNGAQIGSDQAISLFAGKTDDVFVDWTPTYGNHRVAAKIFPYEPDIDSPNNNWVVTEIYVIQDTDHDGTPNDKDDDDDGDSVPDSEDAFPLNPNEQYDTDGDGIGNNLDKDDDNDEVPDEFDDLPLDPNETIDTDKDGIGNIADTDDDGDGLTDTEEENLKTNPLNPDTDSDGTFDKEDAFPLEPDEWLDTDKDKLGNNTDTDDDNDGVPDEEDQYPLNKGPVLKIEKIDKPIGLLENHLFDASTSYDEDGEIVSFLWEIDGKLFEGNALSYTFRKMGEHSVKLTIKDNSGEKRIAEFQANVTNQRFYLQIGLSIFAVLLALIIFLKYISPAENQKSKAK
ncbi:MAG: PKD domain-containing protein [Candidatus Peregrinibacteria bacterium]